jgi:hypothetical protein
MSDNQPNPPAYNWSRFVERIDIKTEKKRIYDALTTPGGLEKWFLRKANFISTDGKKRNADQPVQKGDSYEWYWYGWDDSMAETGTVIEMNGADLFKFSFGKAGDVSFTIKTEENETIFELVQENIPVDESSRSNFHVGCLKGWAFYVTNLKSILEGGIDLRNRNVALRNMVNS